MLLKMLPTVLIAEFGEKMLGLSVSYPVIIPLRLVLICAGLP